MKKTKLKTLKDLDYWLTDELFYEQGRKRYKWAEEQKLINVNDLKEEVIKWVKECTHCKFIKYKQKDNDEPIQELITRDFCLCCLKWMRFFNLTEEDLK